MAISVKFVTIMVADDVCSRARESAYSTREETCPLESNRLSDYRSMVLDICDTKNNFSLTRGKTIGAGERQSLNPSAVKVAPQIASKCTFKFLKKRGKVDSQ
jgi:hypothetical protein